MKICVFFFLIGGVYSQLMAVAVKKKVDKNGSKYKVSCIAMGDLKDSNQTIAAMVITVQTENHEGKLRNLFVKMADKAPYKKVSVGLKDEELSPESHTLHISCERTVYVIMGGRNLGSNSCKTGLTYNTLRTMPYYKIAKIMKIC